MLTSPFAISSIHILSSSLNRHAQHGGVDKPTIDIGRSGVLARSGSEPGAGDSTLARAPLLDAALRGSSIAPLLVPCEGKDGLARFLSALFAYVKTGAGVNNADEAYGTFKAFLAVHVELQKLYGTSDAQGYAFPFLNQLILAICRTLVSISHVAANASTKPIRDHASPRGIKDATRQAIEKTMQVSSAHMDSAEWGRQGQDGVGDIMWAVGNILWRLYAQATELSKTFGSLQPSEKARLESRGYMIPRTDVAETYYWRGRLGVVLLDMRGAKWWLDKAWAMCPENAWQQRRAILIRLVPVNLLLGYLPSPALLQQYDLPYAPFIHAFRTGNVAAWRHLIHEHRAWLRARSLWLLLFERGEILVWRNLFRKALSIHYQLNPSAPKNRVETQVFLSAARAAFAGTGEVEDGVLGMPDIVCVVSSLVDQLQQAVDGKIHKVTYATSIYPYIADRADE
ncbi:hypothetical protein A1Q1_05445 [Trichosporon asahii var. asahii CBS 2479]|uniref:Uncharacterized protein n=1 Tax=Trichosporon asahii var. asahii (strain ATCC 90039 / CBS 2479 / JCM 2466 / KCTC 7840 / NBRC 103889/ NCYC 2677 / UAMH 7654) TaxID=1186058 RepID=J4U735_TRIAS|nr:hypothetical protein A1Q1_05445 [Trichosporon asahii var. asahii CBS 2479]EJT46040.1 hypothetical protein A1Q1_05445 [Trichosporon asahii var. asahii CBS 2479]